MLSLGCERLPAPYLHHDLGMLPLLRCFLAHLDIYSLRIPKKKVLPCSPSIKFYPNPIITFTSLARSAHWYATTTLRCFFAHLLILEYPDHHQNLISSSLYYSGSVHKISSQSVHNFLSNVVKQTNTLQTNKQTDRQTN